MNFEEIFAKAKAAGDARFLVDATNPVRVALEHVRGIYPDVCHVIYEANGCWTYCDSSFNAPAFKDARIDMSIIEAGADSAYMDGGFPCVYSIA